ncbi:hypothetical protein K439DRAFT_1060931 [Ramaria rubella]|nr:hypothetical protein K439DRAFT_1060931 [Ramaria rubella]
MNGGRMPVGDMQATQPLLGNATVSSSNPFGSPSPSATSGAVQSLSSHPSYPSTTPPVQYDPNANHGLDYPAAQYQQPPTGQYDTSLISGHPYPQYYDPNTPQTGSTPQIAQV